MKKPKLNDLKSSPTMTRKVRSAMAKQTSIKITINIDADTLKKIRELSAETGVPYQRLMNKLLKERLENARSLSSRIAFLEKEIGQIKKKLAA